MRIGKQDQPFSAHLHLDAEAITVRGRDLCGELIGKTDFTSYFWLLVTGEQPNDKQRFFADAVLAAIAEHGLVPSVVAARMTYAAAPEAFQGAVAAGLLGCGSVVLGSAEAGRPLPHRIWSRAATIPKRRSRACAPTRRRFRASAIRSMPAAIRAPICCCSSPRRKTRPVAHIKALYAVRDALPEAIGRAIADQRQRRDPGGDARRRLPAGGA